MMVLFLSVLLYLGNSESLIVFACQELDVVEILVDKFDEKLIQISSVEFDSFVEFLNLQNVEKFTLEDRVIIEGYSNKLTGYIVSNNKKINVQISITDNECLVGSPLIKNSF